MEGNSQTYVNEVTPNSEQLVKIRRKELNELRIKAQEDRKFRLAKKAERRVIRDDKIERINLKIKSIKENIICYNRAGKKKKDNIDILGMIYNLVRNDEDLTETIERIKLDVDNFDVEAESVDEKEISPPGY